jgi:ERCC4-type nuclease
VEENEPNKQPEVPTEDEPKLEEAVQLLQEQEELLRVATAQREEAERRLEILREIERVQAARVDALLGRKSFKKFFCAKYFEYLRSVEGVVDLAGFIRIALNMPGLEGLSLGIAILKRGIEFYCAEEQRT